MQIRVANRQDEPTIRALVEGLYADSGMAKVDLLGKDSDLNNVDAQYFWFDGIFVVAEEEGEIVGFAGARRGATDTDLHLLRLFVVAPHRRKGIARLLMNTVVFFAGNSDYKRIVYDAKKHGAEQKTPCLGFTAVGAGAEQWTKDVPAVSSCANLS